MSELMKELNSATWRGRVYFCIDNTQTWASIDLEKLSLNELAEMRAFLTNSVQSVDDRVAELGA